MTVVKHWGHHHRSQDLSGVMDRVAKGRAMQGKLLMEKVDGSTTQPLLDAVALFEHLGIRYALIGGIAAMYYGRARFTDDVDFVADFLHERVLAENPDSMAAHRFDPSCTYKLYHATGVDIDLWKDEFVHDILDRARDATLAGRVVKIVDPNDLAAMKLRAGRPQDDYDISEMIKAGAVDEVVLKARVTDDQLRRFVDIRSRTPLV